MADAVGRSTAVNEGTPRFAILGSTSYTDVEVSIKVATNNAAAEDKFAYAIARWTDANNHVMAKLTLSNATDTLYIINRVASVETVLNQCSILIPPNEFHQIRLVVLASGRVIATVLNDAGAIVAETEASSSVLATGGTLATGKPGFADRSTGTTAAVRTYDSFYAATPAAEPIACYSGQSIEFRHDDPLREDSSGTYWGPPPSYRGGRFLLPPAGDENRTSRVFVKARRNDVATAADDQIADSTKVELFYTPRWSVLPR